MSERHGHQGRWGGRKKVKAKNGIGCHCSVTLSQLENKDIVGFNTAREREAI